MRNESKEETACLTLHRAVISARLATWHWTWVNRAVFVWEELATMLIAPLLRVVLATYLPIGFGDATRTVWIDALCAIVDHV